MPCRLVRPVADFVYHVTNRAHEGVTLFDSPGDYHAFVDLIAEAQRARPIRLLAFCVMPNHMHLVVWPETDDAVERFVGWLTLTHAKRYNQWHGTSGPVYPRRYQSISVQTGPALYRVIRYVERNPCAAHLTYTAAAWPWSSASSSSPIRLAEWPVPRPPDWRTYVETAIESTELEEIRRHLKAQPVRRLRARKRDDFDW